LLTTLCCTLQNLLREYIQRGDKGEQWRGELIYFCKCHNVPPSSTTIKTRILTSKKYRNTRKLGRCAGYASLIVVMIS
jgi:hypothetical protein